MWTVQFVTCSERKTILGNRWKLNGWSVGTATFSLLLQFDLLGEALRSLNYPLHFAGPIWSRIMALFALSLLCSWVAFKVFNYSTKAANFVFCALMLGSAFYTLFTIWPAAREERARLNDSGSLSLLHHPISSETEVFLAV